MANPAEVVALYCAIAQLFIMCGPIFLMVYYFGAQEYLLEATCTLDQDVVGPFMEQSWDPEAACYATRVTVKELSNPLSTFQNELLVLSLTESVQIDPNATQASEFSCYYSDNNTGSNTVSGDGWKPLDTNKGKGKGKGQLVPHGCTTPDLQSYCYGEDADGSAKDWCYAEYFYNRTRYVSFVPQQKWNQDDWLLYVGWVNTSLFLLEIAVYLSCAYLDSQLCWQRERASITLTKSTSPKKRPVSKTNSKAPAVAMSMDVVVKVNDGPPSPKKWILDDQGNYIKNPKLQGTSQGVPPPPDDKGSTPPPRTAALMEDLSFGQQLKPTPIKRNSF